MYQDKSGRKRRTGRSGSRGAQADTAQSGTPDGPAQGTTTGVASA
jgi:hypothetical protein